MKIEISLADNGKPLANSYSKFYTSQSDPIVDVVVREAIQNSLDAGLSTQSNSEVRDYVKVDFSVGEFVSKKFSTQLEGITDKINTLYPENKYSYLSIRDTYTSGLTGPLNFPECEDPENPGNLIKLVFNIAQPNTNEGAGGSCGIGKTIFYTLGAGIIAYYSRIYNGDGFESRLVVSMIETKHTKIIPDLDGEKNIGIAWWGDQYENRNNKIIPITEESRINEFLRIFGITPYEGKETGTNIIIPYINQDELASRNAKIGNNSLTECIRQSVQRWYFPRLLNPTYTTYFSTSTFPNGSKKHLRVSIDGAEISKAEFYPAIRIYQCLYNYALTGENDSEEKDYLRKIGIEIKHRIDININKSLENTNSGYLAYCYVSKEALRMTPPDNNPSPHEFLYIMDSDGKPEGASEPILGFCRRAGMIGSYNCDGWLKRGVPTLPDEKSGQFLLSLFVLNSSNRLISSNISSNINMLLDEYVRKSELNDHKDWKNDTDNIIERIKKNTASRLSSEIRGLINDDEEHSQREGKLAKALSKALLPPTGFGRKATPPAQSPKGGNSNPSKSHGSFKLIEPAEYTENELIATYKFSKPYKADRMSFDLCVALDNGKMSLTDWIEMGLNIPFGLVKMDSPVGSQSENIDEISEISYEYTPIEGTEFSQGLDIHFENPSTSFEGSLKFKIRLFDRSVKPIITYKNS